MKKTLLIVEDNLILCDIDLRDGYLGAGLQGIDGQR